MKIERQFVECIDVKDRLRAVNADKVKQLAESISAVGLLNPVSVIYSDDGATCTLVAGAHRLAAAKLLGWESIDTTEIVGSELIAQLAEIDENLCRSELTPTQEAEHLARRKEVWEAMEAKSVSGQVYPKLSARGRDNEGRPEGFASSTADVTGKSKESINRAIRRATEVCEEARDLIRGTALDTGSYLDSIAKSGKSPEQQVQHVKDALDALSDRERRSQLAEEARAREEAAKQLRREAREECCNFLFEELNAQKWGYLIDMLERAGGAIKADDLRNWEAPLAKVA